MDLVAAWVTLVIFLIIYLVAIWLVVRVIRFGIRGLIQYANTFGNTVSARMIGLAVAAWFYPAAIYHLVMAPIHFVLGLIGPIFSSFAQLQYYYPGESNAGVFSITGSMAQHFGDVFARSFSAMLDKIYLIDLIYVIAIWVIVGQIMSLVIGVSDSGHLEPSRNRLVNLLQRIQKETWNVAALIFLFLFGALLSVASITAIPWLEEEGSKPLTEGQVMEFKKTLDGALTDKEQWNKIKKLGLNDTVNPLRDLALYVEAEKEKVKNNKTNKEKIIGRRIELVESRLDEKTDEWKRDLRDWREFVNAVEKEEQKLLITAVSEFRTQIPNIGGARERSIYIQRLSAWFRNGIILLQNDIAETRRYMEDQYANLVYWAKDIQEELKNAIEDSVDTKRALYDYSIFDVGLRKDSKDIDKLLYSYKERNRIFTVRRAYSGDVPKPPQPGVGWGPFGWIAGPLLSSQTPSLALITGMLGVGLLGATVSSFVRRELGGDESGIKEEDLIGVIVRGFAAALVIFLAVKGGLAIFAVGSSEPNSYTVLFICFLGAVFSQDAWRSLGEFFRDRFNKPKTE